MSHSKSFVREIQVTMSVVLVMAVVVVGIHNYISDKAEAVGKAKRIKPATAAEEAALALQTAIAAGKFHKEQLEGSPSSSDSSSDSDTDAMFGQLSQYNSADSQTPDAAVMVDRIGSSMGASSSGQIPTETATITVSRSSMKQFSKQSEQAAGTTSKRSSKSKKKRPSVLESYKILIQSLEIRCLALMSLAQVRKLSMALCVALACLASAYYRLLVLNTLSAVCVYSYMSYFAAQRYK